MYTDLLILFLIFCLAIVGYFRGFVDQLLSILSLVALILFTEPLAVLIHESLQFEFIQAAPLFTLYIVSAVLILSMGIALKLILSVKKTPILIPFDRLFGFLLGGVKAFVLFLALLTAYQALPHETRMRFSEMDQDMSESSMVAASQTVFEFHSIDLIHRLRAIRSVLEGEETKLEEGTPWDWGFGVDKDEAQN